MNGEIYLLNNTNSSMKDDNNFKKAIELFKKSKIDILYKTELDNNKTKLLEAFKTSRKSKDKIKFILIPEALDSDDKEQAQKFFENMGLDKKVRVIRGRLKTQSETPENDTEKDSSQVSIISGEPEEKSDKKKSKKVKNQSPEDKGEICAFYMEYKGVYVAALIKEDILGCMCTEIIEKSIIKYVSKWTNKTPFWQRIIPYKGDGVLEVIRKVVLMISIIVFIVSASMLVNELVIIPLQHQKTQDNIKNLYPAGDTNNSKNTAASKIPVVNSEGDISYVENPDNLTSEGTLKDFSMLIETNPDTAGWIKVNNTQIDNVVVYRPSDTKNEYYLEHDFYGNYTKYGTVFVDYRSYDGVKSKNIILHGHHMNDGSMFGGLVYTYEKLDFYKQNPTLTFDTIYEKAEWKVIAVVKIHIKDGEPEFNYFKGTFASDSDFLNYVYQMRARSIIDCPVDVNEDDTILTLSTCSYELGKDIRTVVVARKVRTDESSDVDVSQARYNPYPLMPYVWYDTYGGVPPTVTVFEDAYQKGLIDWYLNPHNKDWSDIPSYEQNTYSRPEYLYENSSEIEEPTYSYYDEPYSEPEYNSSEPQPESDIPDNPTDSSNIDTSWDEESDIPDISSKSESEAIEPDNPNSNFTSEPTMSEDDTVTSIEPEDY